MVKAVVLLVEESLKLYVSVIERKKRVRNFKDDESPDYMLEQIFQSLLAF